MMQTLQKVIIILTQEVPYYFARSLWPFQLHYVVSIRLPDISDSKRNMHENMLIVVVTVPADYCQVIYRHNDDQGRLLYKSMA